MAFSPASFRHIVSISLAFAPLSPSIASRSIRLILSSLPTNKLAAGGELPEIVAKTVPSDEQQSIEVLYKNKQTLKLGFQEVSASAKDLIKKMEQPAKALRMKEEGI